MATRGVALDALTAMRVKCWLAGLLASSGCRSVEELMDVPALADVSELEFGLYAQQRRKPGDVTLKLVDQVFPETRELYEVGPYGVALWKILEGDPQACTQAVNAELQRIGEDLTRRLSFSEKAVRLWLFMLPEHLHHWKSLEELVSMPEFNIVAKTYATGQGEDTHAHRVQGRVYSASLISAVIALWKLCRQYPDSEADTRCRYMLEGVLEEAVREEFPEEIGAMLKAYLLAELAVSP